MSALQMEAARTKITDLHHRISAQALFQPRTPLLDVLWRRPGLHAGEAHHRHPQHCGGEVERLDGWRKVIALVRLRKYIWHIVPLVAPGIHVNRRKEHSVRCMEHQPSTRK